MVKGQFLPQHWNDSDFRICWNLYLRVGIGCDLMALDAHSARGSGHQLRRSHERWRNVERYGSCNNSRHLQHLQS